MATNITAPEYLTQSELKLRTFKREWEAFTKEAPTKLLNLVKSGIKPNVTSTSHGNQIGVTLSFSSNPDAAKKYVKQIEETIDKKSEEIESTIKAIDKAIQEYIDEGLDSDHFTKLVSHLNDWIAYIPKMGFTLLSRQINFEASDEIAGIKKKWETVSAEELKKLDAQKYGIAIADVDKHRAYMSARGKKLTAKTSADMKKAELAFNAIKGYLDSADLAKACAEATVQLKAKEEAAARAKKELEEARKREEAERYQKALAEHKQQVEDIKKAREAYIKNETIKAERKYKDALDHLKKRYDQDCKYNKISIEKLTAEKAKFEQELEKTGLFEFNKKRQLRLEIDDLDERIRHLIIDKKTFDSKYETATAAEEAARESAIKDLPTKAEQQYVIPPEPRK